LVVVESPAPSLLLELHAASASRTATSPADQARRGECVGIRETYCRCGPDVAPVARFVLVQIGAHPSGGAGDEMADDNVRAER